MGCSYTDGVPDFWGSKNLTHPDAKYYVDSEKVRGLPWQGSLQGSVFRV